MTRRHTLETRAVIAGVVTLLAAPLSQHLEAQRWGRPAAPRAGACFYRDANFQGDYFCLSAGQDVSQVPNRAFRVRAIDS
jgi:hypothetical protein